MLTEAKVFKQLRHAVSLQGRTMQNKRAKYSNFKYQIISRPKLHKFVVE